jgi:peptide deformylase
MEFSLEHTNILRTPSTLWFFNSDNDAVLLEQQMIDFMIKNKGIGLAANQIGIAKRVFVMLVNDDDQKTPLAIFNPKIIESSQDYFEDYEGCLSFPGLWLKVKRSIWIDAEFWDSSGHRQQKRFKNIEARCFQHELEHLDGVCFTDKVSQFQLALAVKKSSLKPKRKAK